jgi:hypothetical protein
MGGLGRGPRVFRLPGFAQFLSPCEDMGFRLVETSIDACAFYGVARSAASHEIAWIFLSLMGARNHKINAHDQRVFKTCTPIQATIATDIVIAFQNLAPFFNRYGGIHKREGNEANRHKDLPGGSRAEREGRYDFRVCENDVRTDRRRCQDVRRFNEMRVVVFRNGTRCKMTDGRLSECLADDAPRRGSYSPS